MKRTFQHCFANEPPSRAAEFIPLAEYSFLGATITTTKDSESGLGSSVMSMSVDDQEPGMMTPKRTSFSERLGLNQSVSRWVIGRTLISPLRVHDDSVFNDSIENEHFLNKTPRFGRRRTLTKSSDQSPRVPPQESSVLPSNSRDTSSGTLELKFDGRSISALADDGLIRIGYSDTTSLINTTPARETSSPCNLRDRSCANVSFNEKFEQARFTLRSVCAPRCDQTPSKILAVSPSKAHVGPGDLLNGALLSLTSTPVAFADPIFESHSSVEGSRPTLPAFSDVDLRPLPVATTTPVKLSSLCDVLPVQRTPLKVLFPRTPTPFKKAYAAAERKGGPINLKELQQSPQLYEDLKEIIIQDIVLPKRARTSQKRSKATRRLGVTDRSDRILDLNSTPSKVLAETSLALSPMSTMMPSAKSTPLTKGSTARTSSGGFITPAIPPEMLSDEWFRIVCGRTSAQIELTEMAKQLLGISSP